MQRNDPTLTMTLAAFAWLGVLLQLYLSLQLAGANGKTVVGGIVAFLGYFTILTYPYPFVDVATIGYQRALLNAFCL